MDLGHGYKVVLEFTSKVKVSASINDREISRKKSVDYLNHGMDGLRGDGYVLQPEVIFLQYDNNASRSFHSKELDLVIKA